MWKHLIDELSLGVVLRPPRDHLNNSVPLQVDMSPFSQLLQDIQLRRYTLRKVKVTFQHKQNPLVCNVQSVEEEIMSKYIRKGDLIMNKY